MSQRSPRIGISACFFHADPQRPIFKGKTLLYLEESMAHYVMSAGGMPFLLPTWNGPFDVDDVVAQIDGLVLHGGADVSPKSYGEEPLNPQWEGDFVRDQYEIGLVQACLRQDKPVFGICRGIQVLNVAFGGDLYQDLATQREDGLVHRDWNAYDQLSHEIELVPGSRLHELYGVSRGFVNSVHHQGIRTLAEGLRVEATATPDGVVEAVRLEDSERFAFGVQWHPEFQPIEDEQRLDRQVILEDFMGATFERLA